MDEDISIILPVQIVLKQHIDFATFQFSSAIVTVELVPKY